jgi:hypothetical protein
MRCSLFLFFSFVCLACSSSSGGTPSTPGGDPGAVPPPAAPPPPAQDDTWADGKSLSGAVVIPAGSTITIAPGASISAGSGATITVQGKLVAKSAAGAHAKITGSSWKGIVVASGGDASLDGVDIAGADVAIDVQNGGSASYDDGSVTGTPFKVEKGGKLTTAHADVKGPDSSTDVSGSFTASYLHYDENDQHAIIADDPSAVVFIEDSTFLNTGHRGPTAAPDLLTVNAAASFHIAYSDVSGAHCGFHFVGGDTIEIDHVTVHGVSNGADVWGSSKTGKHTVTASNFESLLSVAFDESGSNGAFSVSGCYVSGTSNLASPSQISISNAATGQVADAHPR